MSAVDTAKEVVRIASTAGLAKDVIDLMDKKLALLTEELASLRKENDSLKSKNLDLETQLKRFRGQEQHPKPVLNLDDNAAKALRHIFDRQGQTVPVAEIAGLLKCTKNEAQYFCDILKEREYIRFNTAALLSRGGRLPGYTITVEGRKFVMESMR